LTFGKFSQLPESFGICRDPAILIDFAVTFVLVIHWTLLQFSFEFLPAIPMFSCHHVHSLEHAASPTMALVSVRSIEF
jgi:hypothetical protein